MGVIINGGVNIGGGRTLISSPYILPPVITDGLVLRLDAGDSNSYPGSGTTWNDISGNGFNATMSGSVAYSSSLPASFQYVNATNNYFLGNNDLTGSIVNGVTISSWVKINNNAVRSVIFSKYNSSGIPGYVLEAGTVGGLWTNTLRLFIQGTLVIASDYRGVANAITQGAICLVSATFDYATKTTAMYINATAISATQVGGNQANISSDWYKSTPLYRVGSYRPIENVDAAMNQYNLIVYNRALTASEILQNYNAQKSSFGL